MTNVAHMRSKAIRMHGEGMRARDIAKELGVPPLAVHNWLPGSTGDTQFETMAAMRAKGMTNIEIAEHTGVSRQRVSKVLGPVRRPTTSDIRTTIRVPRELIDGLNAIAEGLGLQRGKSSDKYSQIVYMLAEIAAGRITVKWKTGHGPFSYLADVHSPE